MKTSIKMNSTSLIFVMLLFCPLFDNINGFLLLNGKSTSVSSSYKSLLMIICFAFLLSKRKIEKKSLNRIFIGFMLIFINLIIALFQDVSSLSYNINNLIKLLMPYVIYGYLMKKKDLNVKRLLEIFSWFYPLSLIIPSLLNIGYKTYTNGLIGSKGFYYAGNEISVVMIIIFAYSFQNFIEQKSMKYVLNLVLNTLASIFIGTKSVYFAMIIIVIMTLIPEIKNRKKLVRTVLIAIFFVLFAVVIGYFGSGFFSELVDVWSWNFYYYFKGKNENEVLSFLLSMRDLKLENAFDLYKSNFGILGIFFGGGPYLFCEKNSLIVEMDIFDLIFWYGILFFIYFIYILFCFFRKIWYFSLPCQKGLIISVVLASFFSGHVIFAPSVTLVFVLYLYTIKEEQEVDNIIETCKLSSCN